MIACGACAKCGTQLRANAKFCDECGAPTTAAAHTPEYKQVTVLFADVVRSMDIAAAVDTERLREIMTVLVERAAAVVNRYGGTAEYNGDGVMALFGAPVALEDHAVRGCLAALAIQDEANRLSADVQRRDGVALQLRVGLDSGQVIAGEIGSGSMGYAATGHHVGMAQRIESAAPPGGVLLSESTALLVEHLAALAEPEHVRIKGAADPVAARRLLAIDRQSRTVPRAEAGMVGRRWEMAVLDAMVDRAVGGQGGVVNVVGPPGIGKSRVAREVCALASGRGIDIAWTFCESHASDISFHAISELLRASSGVADLEGESARLRLREAVPESDPEDLALLEDLLGLSDPDVSLPPIDPDARRRRLTALLNSAALARTEPALFIIEDAHWIDALSESMLADFLAVVPQTRLLVLVTSRPEYEGALSRVRGAQSIALAPLGDPDTEALLGELLGTDPSVDELAATVCERAAGNPFFAEEMVRELAQRGVLLGERGRHVCRTDAADVAVPATVQAAIKARIDRLGGPARRTLAAASVIGARFGHELLTALRIDADVDELLATELIEQVRFTPSAEYAFRHPLIRAVAYESQLKSDRAETHRRLAAAIEEHHQASLDENASLIAEHAEAAGELHAAYGWQMRAAARSAKREVAAARVNWERARSIADKLPADDPARMQMRIAARTMLCATDFHARTTRETRGHFAELRELCDAADDKVSLAIGMTGLASELLFGGDTREASQLAYEQTELLDSISDPNLTVGLPLMAFLSWFNIGDFDKLLRRSRMIVDLADGDPTKGAGFGVGSPLAVALAFGGVARWWLGRDGWKQDFQDAVAMARNSDPTTFALVVSWSEGVGIALGVRRADDSALRVIEDAMQTAQRASSDFALLFAKTTLGLVLLHRETSADRDRGMEIMAGALGLLRDRIPSLVPVFALITAREEARRGKPDAISAMSQAVDDLHRAGRLAYLVHGIQALVEALLERGAEGDVARAQAEIDRLANWPAPQASPMIDITLLRVRALLARAHGDTTAYKDLAGRYHSMANSLGYEGHIAWAEAMLE
ncbi:cyclase [Mycolicibacterium moriokaense]|nr:cyclase [Mycolicibacterium moriokaense]